MSNPSLLCVPYRFKTSTLYSQIPDSGLGDFIVTRSASNAATRVNAAGFIETVADNVPRLDYPLGGITAGCPALLIEPSAVNYLVRSQEFDNASWGKNTVGINTSIGTNGIEANVAISPDGTQNADRVNFLLQIDPDLGLTQNYAPATTGQTYNTSIWFKGEGTNIGKQIKVQIKRISGGTFVGTTATITLTSGWVRFASSAITLGASNSGIQIVVSSNDATNVLIWGAQLEQGSIPTSYIPTTTAAITRGADVVSKTGVSSLIGQTEGTFYLDLTALSKGSSSVRWIQIFGASNNIGLAMNGSNQFRSIVNAQSDILLTAPLISSGVKVAWAYDGTGTTCFINGTQYTLTNGGNQTMSSLTSISIDGGVSPAFGFARIRAAAIYPTRLPNTGPLSLQSLTQ